MNSIASTIWRRWMTAGAPRRPGGSNIERVRDGLNLEPRVPRWLSG